MKYLIILFSAALLFMTAACEKVIKAKNLPQQDPRLVANCILYPDSPVVANISVSKSILTSKDYKYLDNAVCELYEDDNFAGNLVYASKGNYTSSVLPKTGKKYSLKVVAGGYNGVSATTSLPPNVSVTHVERYDTAGYMLSISEYSTGPSTVVRNLQGLLKYKFSVVDDRLVKNYYSVRPVVILYDEDNNATRLPYAYIYNSDNGNSFGNDNNYSSLSLTFDDQVIVNGNEIKLDVKINFSQNLDFSYELKNIKIFLEVYNLSPEYYKYQVTLNDQYNTGASLFAEPVQVYSNVSNGMGIVAGVNTNSVLIYPQ